jgi:hypothetical protein
MTAGRGTSDSEDEPNRHFASVALCSALVMVSIKASDSR